MDLDTERTATSTRSANPVGIQFPSAAALEVPPTPSLPPTTRADRAAKIGEKKRMAD